MFAALAHYFRGREAVGVMYKERIPEGIYGSQLPDAMVALTATAVSAHLLVLVKGANSSRLMERSRLALKNLSLDSCRTSRRRRVVRSTGAT